MSAETVFQSPNEIIPWSGSVFLSGTGKETPGYSERPGDLTHQKGDTTPAPTFDTSDITAISPFPQSPAVFEKPAAHPMRLMYDPIPLGMTDQQFLAELDGDVRSKYGISRVGFDAVWGDRDVIISAIPQERPAMQADHDGRWHEGIANNAYGRLARETGYAASDIRATNPGDELYEQIHRDKHLGRLLAKAERHERHLAVAREKQAGVDQARADDRYAADHASKMYEPVREAREAAQAASDAKAEHVSYVHGLPTHGVDFEGYAQHVDVNGKTLTAIHQAYDPRAAQDLALKAEEAIEAAAIAKNDLTKAQTAGDPGAAYLMAGMPLSAIAYKGGRIGKALAVLIAGGSVLTACGGASVPDNPTAHPPTLPLEPTHSNPPTIAASVEMVAALPDVLPEPGKPQVVAGLSSVIPGQGEVLSTAPLDNRIVLALNEQGVKPFFGKDDKGNSIFSADVSVDGKKVCLPTAPEQIANKNDPLQVFNYVPDGSASPMVGFGSPDLLGEAGDSHNVIRYGATTNGQTDIAGILSPVLPSLENTDCAYGSVINADITPNPNDFNGAVVGVHYDPETGEIKAYNSPVLVDPNEARINVQSNGEILLDGQPMESRVWVGNATATPIPTFTPAPTFTPEPSATPDTYGVEVVSHIESDVTLEQYSGVRVQYSFDVDESMKGRARKPIGAVEFFSSDWYKHPNGLSAQEAGAESLMRGIWYAWADDDPSRVNIPFEQYMQMVAEYQQGKRPLDDVAFKVFADDLTNPGYSPVVTTFDPTTPVRFVLSAKTNNMSEYVLTNAADQAAFGTQKGPNGLELWLNISSDIAGGERSSYMVTANVAGALLRLTWPAQYQTRQSMPYPVGDFTDFGRVHKDIYTVMEYDGPYGRFGAFTIPPEWSDKRGG